MTLLLLTIMACTQSPADSMQDYREALSALEEDARDAAVICEKLTDPQLQVDCMIAGAEQLARTLPEEAAELCERIPEQINKGISRDECLFQVAERSKDADRCKKAGRFADPCRMHLWGSQLPTLAGSSWKEKEAEAESRIQMYGLQQTDIRPWIALYRWLLSQDHPLTRKNCATALQTDACMDAGISLLQDRLNRMVGLQQLPCTPDEPVPSLLQVTDDEALLQMITRRQATECR